MPQLRDYLANLDADPDTALADLESLSPQLFSAPDSANVLDEVRETLRARGELEAVARLFDLELEAVTDDGRRADLLLEKGKLYADDLLEEQTAVECFNRVLELRPDHEEAAETLANIDLVRENWQKIVDKYVEEAKVSTDRQLTTSLYLSAAETYARYQPRSEEVEGYLRAALSVDPGNRRAAIHLERLLRAAERWSDLADLLAQRVEAADKDERVQALVALADLCRSRLDDPARAVECMKKVVGSDPAHPRALRMLADAYEQEENWSALVMLYTNALKARRRGPADPSFETGTLLQIAMLHWKRLDNQEAAEEYFRRIRKAEPAHPAALEFYRHYYPERGEGAKLLQILRQAHKSLPRDADDRRRQLAVEMAEVAETQLGNPEKAVDAWKGILRADPQARDARAALMRLYRKTEKWNALLDLMKEEVDRLPADDIPGRVERLLEVVAIYRDRLKLDVMVINTYNSILKLDPGNRQALDELAEKYAQLGRWNDLIAVLSSKAELSTVPVRERAEILRRIAGLWSERFGNYAQAIKPLEQLVELVPDDRQAIDQLKDIYTRRRQWRALIGLLAREAAARPVDDRRAVLAEMAQLAAERLGDNRLAIDIWNRVLELPRPQGAAEHDAQALDALAGLYEREKRWPALVEILRRQRAAAEGDTAAATSVLERLGGLLADRLGAPDQAAVAYTEILDLDPGHGRALRTLRELYGHSGDYQALERLLGRLGQWDELVDTLQAMGDRADDAERKVLLYRRAAAVAAEHLPQPEKVARAYERVLSVDPNDLDAARALIPVYQRTAKWARLLSTYEVLLAHAGDDDRKLELQLQIRDLCEQQLGSKALAFQWTARAYELRPDDEQLLADLERLGAEADAWDEVAEVLDRRVADERTDDGERLRLLRELGKIAAVRLHQPERARDYQRRVLELAPDDPRAMQALEEIATQLSEWPDLLRVYRRKAEIETEPKQRLDLLFKIAFIEEERVADLDAAAKTYQRILEHQPGSQRALRALAKLQGARGDWKGLAEVLERELAAVTDVETQVELHLRLGKLYENDLGQGETALGHFERALDRSPGRAQALEALERFVHGAPAGTIAAERRVEVARRLLGIYEQRDDAARIAAQVEVLRGAADDLGRLDHDRRLVGLYGERLGDAEAAYGAALRVLEAAPDDRDNRAALIRHAAELDRSADLAELLEVALASAGDQGMDPASERALAADLAHLYEERLGRPDAAEKAWLRVLELEATDAGAYEALDRIYRGAERWTDLRDLLMRQEANVLDAGERKAILLAICDLHEGVLDDARGALDAYRRVLDIDPSGPAAMRAYKALERLYAEAGRWRELDDLLARELEYVEDAEHLRLTFRRADLKAHQLEDPMAALDLAEDVLARSPGHSDARELLEELMPNPDLRLRIARTLEPLYEADGLWRDLCLVLRAQREFAVNAGEAVDLLARVAAVEEERLGHERAAFETWTQAMATEPRDGRAREAVRRLASQLALWADAAAAYEKAIATVDEGDLMVRSELLGELAEIYDRHLASTEQAMTAYRRQLEADPSNPEVVRAAGSHLSRLYEEEQRWPELIDILRRRAEWTDGPDERRELLGRVAVLEEEKQNDTGAAIATWREVLTEDPDDRRALDALERLYVAGDKHGELVEILRRRVELAGSAEDRKVHLRRIAELQERHLSDLHEAVLAHLEILDHLPDDRQTMGELSRLYRDSERWVDLLEITERRLAMAPEGSERLELTYELGALLHERLQRENEALERFAEVLSGSPTHERARAAVEGMLDDAMLRLRAAEVLQPIYESGSEAEKLAALHLRVADAVEDPRERLRRLRQVARLREQELGDAPGAFEVMARATRAAVAEPDLPEVLGELERLAAVVDREAELVDIYVDIVPDVLDGELQRKLELDIAELARAVKGDTAMAVEHYQKVLDVQPDDLRALNALESIYREGEQHRKLHDILVRKAEVLAADMDALDARVLALAEAARLCATQLGRPDDAVMSWEQVLELAPENKEAARALEGLYESAERWHDLVELIERRLGFADSLEEAVAARVRLGEICENHLHDPDTAVDNYSAALGGDPNNPKALAALERFLDDPGARAQAAEVLEPIYVSRQDWPKLVRIYEIKLEAAEDPTQRLALTRYIARLYEDQLEDLEGAFRWYGRVFRETPDDENVRDQLARLATILEDWKGLAHIYQEFLDDEPGDTPATREVALALAEVYDRRLGEVELGLAAYRRALQSHPDDTATFNRLEAMLTRAERWYALVDVYEDTIAAVLDQHRRVDLYRRRARVQEDHLHDPGKAIEAYREILTIEPTDGSAADQLDRLYREQGQWFELTELLQARLERTTDEVRRSQLRLQLADVLEHKLHDAPAAIDQYEAVLDTAAWDQALAPLERLVVAEDHRERIAELLEPVYRSHDWWQKLVVILDAQLQYVDDPERRVKMLREIAELHETRGGDKGLALDALSRAWLENTANNEIYDQLAALAGKLAAWDDLVATLEQGVVDEYDYDLVATILGRVADIHETHRDDAAAAIEAWRRVLEVDESSPVALSSLDRLLEGEGRHEELVAIISRRAELAEDPAVRLVLLHRVAALQENELDNVSEAIIAYKNVLGVDDTDSEALDALERLYRQESEYGELATVLLRKIDLAEDAETRRTLRFTAAGVYDQELSDAFEAIAQLNLILDEDPEDVEALAMLDTLYKRESAWPELLDILDRRAALEAQTGARAELGFRAAGVVERELLEVDNAIDRYAAVLELVPTHAGAREALDRLTQSEDTIERAAEVLERLYRMDSAFTELAELYERRLAVQEAPDPAVRRQQYAELAEVHEISRGDLDTAFAVWARALAEFPEDAQVGEQLERLAAARGAWEELTRLLEERLTDIVDAELEYSYACRLAVLYEEALGDLDRAAGKWRQALEVASDEREPLAALDRLYERAGKPADLAEILAREADAILDAGEQAEFLFRLGDVREQKLGDIPGAVSAYRDVLDRVPQHPAARGALERLQSSADEVKADIIAILEPLYESEGDHARLADLLVARLGITQDRLDRAQIYARVAELAERELSDAVRALDAAGGWLAEDPQSEQALAELERLAADVGRWDEVAARLEGIIEATDDDEVERMLLLRLGTIQLERLGDAGAAEATFNSVLERDPESPKALESLERIYRDAGDRAALAQTLWRRGELAFEADRKRACFVEVGTLREELGDLDGAVAAWQEVMDLDEGDREAHEHLASIHEQKEDWPALVDILTIASRFARSGDEDRTLRTRIARLLKEQLGDLEAAVDAWQGVLDVAPDATDALEALEQVHRQREDWLAVQEVLTRRMDFADDPARRIELLEQLARLGERERDSLDEAVSYRFQILDLDNAHLPTYDQLERLLGKGERWHDLVELLERRADIHGTLGETRAEIDCLARAADVWDGPLENPDASGEILEKILAREPSYVPALTRLARIYENQGAWDRCGEILEQALSLGPSGRDAADLYYRLGEVAKQRDGDVEQAAGHWGQALSHDPAHPQAIAALEDYAREREDWPVVADMLARREAAAEEPADKLELAIELADIYRKKLRQPEVAVPLLERAAQASPDDERILGPLADLYFAAGRQAEAAPIYERLAEEAKKSRKMKDVARYRQRLGGIFESQGDTAKALAAYEEAFRVNPTDVETMAGLGRLYMNDQNWEKARRVYRSMVLQNIDPDLGITKADVYYNLGQIHLALGEGPKAKGMFQRGLEIEPDHAQLRAALDQL